MCLELRKDLGLKVNKKGERVGYKLFFNKRRWSSQAGLTGIVQDYYYQTNKWITSKNGPGFFVYPTKKDVDRSSWSYHEKKKIKCRNIVDQGTHGGIPVFVAKEIFIPDDNK